MSDTEAVAALAKAMASMDEIPPVPARYLVLHVDRAGREWMVPDNLLPGQPGFCRGCPALVLWARTPAGKSTPLNPDGSSHWGTCPRAHSFRRPA